MNLTNLLSRLDQHEIRPLDQHFSQFLKNLDSGNEAIELAGFLVSLELGKGNVCLNLAAEDSIITLQEGLELKQKLKSSELVYVVDAYSTLDQSKSNRLNQCPLVLLGDSLYLQRYFNYEQSLLAGIQSRLQPMPWTMQDGKSLIQSLFNIDDAHFENAHYQINWQAVAACIAVQSKFTVISGGPGTGKTTTVIRLLALIISQYQVSLKRNPIIKLAAPTGKAAMRLTQSITGAKQQLDVDETIKNTIPQKAETLHRLLQRDRQGAFRFNHYNRLHLDVLIVDEASMVDLPLMAKLIQAMPDHGQIVLLGDKDQLASVEAGSVLADICDNENEHGYGLDMIDALGSVIPGDFQTYIENNEISSGIQNHICHLRKSYRFNENSGIGHLAKAANLGSYADWKKAQQHGYEDIEVLDLNDDSYQAFMQTASAEFKSLITQVNPAGMDDDSALALHKAYGHYQILCALKDGPFGVAGINQLIETNLRRSGVMISDSQWYSGRPIIVLENDYGLNLYNGDVGILLPYKNENGDVRLKATFVGTDQKIRWIQPSRLPKHDTVYAMTVHKSQGSEFEHCALVLPNFSVPVLTKELIYTGITRAKNKLTILAQVNILKSSLKKKVQRSSSLGHLLWGQIDCNKNQAEGDVKPSLSQKNTQQNTETKVDDSTQFSLF